MTETNIKIKKVAEKDNEIENKEDMDEGDVEKHRKKTLFNDLRRFKNRKITVFTYSGQIVEGVLRGYDEIANCVIETVNKTKIILFGKMISLISEGELTLVD